MAPLRQSEEPKSPPPAIAYFLGFLVFVAIVLVMWALRPQETVAPPSPDSYTGIHATIAHLNLLPLTGDGRAVSLKDLKDHVLLLSFWGTWCPPCRAELPHMAELQKRFAGRDAFRLVAVSSPQAEDSDDVESLRENTSELLRRLHLDLPTYYDPQLATARNLSALLGLDYFSFPTTVLLDRRGAIRALWFEYRPGLETEMERYVGMVLDEEGDDQNR